MSGEKRKIEIQKYISIISISILIILLTCACSGSKTGAGQTVSTVHGDNGIGKKSPVYLYEYSDNSWKCSELERIMEAYNEQSDSYEIILQDFEYAKTYEDDFDPIKIIAADEFPDLIFSSSNSLTEIFTQKGLLEDLYPYIDNSEKISVSDISKPVLYDYNKNGKLYALPRDFSISAITGKKSQMGDPGWTADEFLTWIIDNPDRDSRMNLSRDMVFDICIDSVLDECVDLDADTADFTGPVFKGFVVKLWEADLPTNTDRPNFDDNMGGGKIIIEEAGIERLYRAAFADALYGEESVFKGYTSKDGTPVYYYDATSLSILSSSKVKEGAYDFIEFYMTYQDEDTLEGAAPLYALKSLTVEGIERTLKYEIDMGGDIVFTPSREQIEKVLETTEYAVPRKERYIEIRKIVEEELQPYFEGSKDIDSVCEVIQGRVTIFLSE